MEIKTKPHLGKRIVATLIDYGITGILFFMYTKHFGEYNEIENNYSVSGLKSLPILIYWFVYHILIEHLFSATLGHFMVDLKVTNLDGEKTAISQNIKRHLLDFLDIFMWGIPAIISIKNTEKNQRLGDLWAKTIVLQPKEIEELNKNQI